MTWDRIQTDTMVMDISHDKVVTAMNRTEGMFQIQAAQSPMAAASVPEAP